MRKKNEHSEEYNKGYRVGYNAGYAKGKGHPKAEKGIFDLTRVRPLVHWETVEGDWETFSCPVCSHSFYSENCEAPNFCYFCGAQNADVKEKEGEENELHFA